jgi:hypothetical protein
MRRAPSVPRWGVSRISRLLDAMAMAPTPQVQHALAARDEIRSAKARVLGRSDELLR